MNTDSMTKKSGRPGPWAWAALGAVLGAGVVAIALARKPGDPKPLVDSLEDLFRICEADCLDLEKRFGNSSKAS